MNDFQVTIQQPVIITGNFEEMQAELSNMMQAYAGLEVTEANLNERKKDVATLRKIKAAIEDKRKETKREYSKPIKAFEEKCKLLTATIDRQIDRINADMDVYEQKRIAEKRETVKRLYDENIGELAEYLPLESLRRPQWDNKTYTEKDIVFDIQESVIAVSEDLRTIETMCEPWVAECKEVYKTSGLTEAFQRFKDLQKAKEVAEASVKGSEQQTPTDTPIAQEKPVEEARTASEWTFTITVNNKDDAKFIRDTCEIMGFQYKEG
jgi:hypothetical protein